MATNQTDVTRASWTLLGTTPCTVFNESASDVLIVIDSVFPAGLEVSSFTIQGGGSAAISYTGQNAYGRALDVPVSLCVVR